MAVNYYNSTREVHVGDRVRCVCAQDGNVSIVGMTGTIVGFDTRSWYDVAVEFDDEMGGHDCGGRAVDGRGYYMYVCKIEYIGNAEVVNDGKSRCSYCGNVIEKSTRLGVRLYRDTPICDGCVMKNIGRVNSYHTGKTLTYAYAKDKITLGCEIEIDDCNDCASRDAVIDDVIDCARKNKYALIMSHESDGSLSNSGFESVTAPLTIDEWRSDEVREQLITLFNSAYDNEFTLDEGHAGLHVHIGRKDLCGTDRRKSDAVGLLMGWAVSRLWDKGFKELSRRWDTEYCHLFDEDGRGENGLYDTDASGYDRYHAVNIDNAKTIELRIFKGARCLDDVLLAVDMCYMLGKWGTKKINAFTKRGSYSAHAGKYDDALAYADKITWKSLVKYSKFPEITIKALREVGADV